MISAKRLRIHQGAMHRTFSEQEAKRRLQKIEEVRSEVADIIPSIPEASFNVAVEHLPSRVIDQLEVLDLRHVIFGMIAYADKAHGLNDSDAAKLWLAMTTPKKEN
ncbi:hypothetical protein DFR48_10739 [Ciceribacter lividus]|uniref:Uncharacterized protein n=1 Tax=Ciceribacter lividus TaxID=1197950 RepID=A0A6I7HJN8_9HYPH|nr:hypothetical protein [Ciceribacter lividus]RCW23170.1 hypothetical protein DFR48_10739 [Ciceribacter lividus]